jgi:tetratricopeptide (TPR) repeat protein
MPDAAFEYDVFVSYSQQDGEWVDKTLLPRLEAANLKVCIDYRDFVAGRMTLANIEDAVKKCRHTLLVLTPQWLQGDWTWFEGFLGRTQDPAGLKRRTVPLLLSPCREQLPAFIAALSWIDFTRPERESIAWHRLLTDLGAAPPKASSEPATRADWLLVHPYGMPPNFTGRIAERRQLNEWLEKENGPALLVLRALGGFGKSALVWHWLSNDLNPACWRRVLWWSFYDDPSFDEFLRKVLPYLGRPDLKGGTREAVDQLVDVLRRSQVLLVLDGFERALRAFARLDAAYHLDDEEKRLGKEEERDCVSLAAEAFLRAVSSLPDLAGRVLITTRLRPRPVETRAGELLVSCREIELTALSPADAVDFFHAECIKGTRSEIETLCRRYGFHPLSLRLLAGMIVKDLRNPRDIATARRFDVSGDLIQRKHHVLEQSYESLPVEGRRLLSRIACFRGAVSYEALRAAAGNVDEREVEAALQDLVERGLLHRDERDGRFDLHPIVRRYAYDRLGKEEKEEAHRSLRDYFAAVPAVEKVKTLADLAPVIELYHHMVRAGEYDAAFELFRDRLSDAMYFQLGAYETCIELLRALFLDGEDRPPRLREERDQGWILNELANSYSLSGQPRRAVPLYEQSKEIAERKEDKGNLAISLRAIASVAQIPTGALRSAEANLRRSVEICQEIDSLQEMSSHRVFGRLLGILGRWVDGEGELATALARFEDRNDVQDQGLIWAYRALVHLGRLRADGAADPAENRGAALAAARRALELADETARKQFPYERDYVQAHRLLGAVWRESGDLAEAERHLSQALERCRRINLVELEADILIDLGRLRWMQGDATEARRLGEEAIAIAERCEYVLQGADAHLLLAALDREKGDLVAAREHAQEALRLATCDGPPDYTYKVAYDEAEVLLEVLKSPEETVKPPEREVKPHS